jgi:hypothetical protein
MRIGGLSCASAAGGVSIDAAANANERRFMVLVSWSILVRWRVRT